MIFVLVLYDENLKQTLIYYTRTMYIFHPPIPTTFFLFCGGTTFVSADVFLDVAYSISLFVLIYILYKRIEVRLCFVYLYKKIYCLLELRI